MANIVETARQLGFFKVLLSALEIAGLEDALENRGPLHCSPPLIRRFQRRFAARGLE